MNGLHQMDYSPGAEDHTVCENCMGLQFTQAHNIHPALYEQFMLQVVMEIFSWHILGPS